MPLASIASTSTTTIDTTISGMAVCSSTPKVAHSDTDTNEPIMKTSPWAKLMSSTMP